MATPEWSPAREARLVARVLESTTRTDPSVRGDLVLCLRYLRTRLAESVLLRVVAASLLLHLAALPVLAYLVLRAERPSGYRISVELPHESPFAPETPESLAPPPEHEGSDAAEHEARLREQIENHLARARFLLQTRGRRAPLPAAGAGTDGAALEIRLLRARGALLRTGLPGAWPSEAELAGASDLALALWTTLVLDRFVLGGELPPGGDLVLARSAQRAAGEEGHAGLRLLRAALSRARRYGLEAGSEGRDPGPGVRPDDALEPEWFTGLAASAGELGLGQEPVVRAWIEWGGR